MYIQYKLIKAYRKGRILFCQLLNTCTGIYRYSRCVCVCVPDLVSGNGAKDPAVQLFAQNLHPDEPQVHEGVSPLLHPATPTHGNM